MGMEMRQELKLSQQLVMTPQLQQAIRLLQLSRMELVDHQPTGYWEGLGYDQNAWVGRSNGYSTL